MTSFSLDRYDGLQFGNALALDAAAFLKRHRWFGDLGAIVRAHRDYTGHGLFHDRKACVFFLSQSQDGLPHGEPLLTFDSDEEFTNWLSSQSDRSLSGYGPAVSSRFNEYPGNQRVTRELILAHIARAPAESPEI
nr:hypothetical protein [uncultured Devosia sp.]